MAESGIIRFEPHGPADTGLVEWDPIDPATLEAGTPVQRGHIYHQDETLGYMAGVWDCTPMTGKLEPYPVHEFMFLLEGSVIMVLEDGSRITVDAGEPFVIPKGLRCQWEQPGTVRKHFVIFEDPGAGAAADVASQGVILPRMSGPVDGAAGGGPPPGRNRTDFRDPSGRMAAGVWDGTAFESELRAHPHHEFLRLLEGALTIAEADGASQTFAAGDTFYLLQGTVCAWKSSGYVKALYATMAP